MLPNMGMAFRLFLKGRLPLLPTRVRGLADLRRILVRAESFDIEYEDEIAAKPTAHVGYGVFSAAPPPSLPAASVSPSR
jgi:hypothetical protein